jgi:hypothetical protein
MPTPARPVSITEQTLVGPRRGDQFAEGAQQKHRSGRVSVGGVDGGDKEADTGLAEAA